MVRTYQGREHAEPICDRPWVVSKGKSESGVQRWVCRNCKLSWTGNPVGRPERRDITCPNCLQGSVKKNGITTKGGKPHQKWICKECGQNFSFPIREVAQ
ncbi:MAG: hypothetical protein KME46_25850 [Brasilonema angustatum HA4187-MV1]|jgi:transposase-like protein|nr:hypothetical protein [Brasilonema angustatum HA4187-MV1]